MFIDKIQGKPPTGEVFSHPRFSESLGTLQGLRSRCAQKTGKLPKQGEEKMYRARPWGQKYTTL